MCGHVYIEYRCHHVVKSRSKFIPCSFARAVYPYHECLIKRSKYAASKKNNNRICPACEERYGVFADSD